MLQQRLNSFRKILTERQIDAFLVSSFYNILYLTGFKTLVDNERESWALVTKKDLYVFTDSRYASGKSDNYTLKIIGPEKGLIRWLQEIVEDEKIKTFGVEADDLKLGEWEKLRQYLEVQFVKTEKIIAKERAIKDKEEIEKVSEACRIADKCLEETLRLIKVGKSEKEIAFKMEFWLKEKGYDLAFDPIVAVDENSSLMHYDTKSGNDKKIKNGSVILIDFGAKYEGYMSDITRMFFVGHQDDKVIDTYKNLLDVQKKTISQMATLDRSGNKDSQAMLKNIDLFCRNALTNDYSLPNFSHSTGHGVGLEVHEFPKISLYSEDLALPGQIVTIEPGVYLPGKWGMRIEDTILIKENFVEVLTKFNNQILQISK